MGAQRHNCLGNHHEDMSGNVTARSPGGRENLRLHVGPGMGWRPHQHLGIYPDGGGSRHHHQLEWTYRPSKFEARMRLCQFRESGLSTSEDIRCPSCEGRTLSLTDGIYHIPHQDQLTARSASGDGARGSEHPPLRDPLGRQKGEKCRWVVKKGRRRFAAHQLIIRILL